MTTTQGTWAMGLVDSDDGSVWVSLDDLLLFLSSFDGASIRSTGMAEALAAWGRGCVEAVDDRRVDDHERAESAAVDSARWTEVHEQRSAAARTWSITSVMSAWQRRRRR